MEQIVFKGFGANVPKLRVSNYDLSELVDTSDQWIVERTGIKERRISEGEDTSEIAIKAANQALERAKVEGIDIDLIIVATITPDDCTPSVACLVQKAIKAKKAIAFDINAACSGFIYALQIAHSMMENNNKLNNALVIGSEVLSKIVNWSDRSTCVLFGDGAGATVLSKEEVDEKFETIFCLKSVGDKGDALMAPAFSVDNPFVKDKNIKKHGVQMNGQAVFKFASLSMASAIKKLLQDSNLTIDDIDYIVPHQANERIIDFTAKKLKIDRKKMFMNLEKYGNTSSASIPIALNEMYEKGMLKKHQKLILVGFGGGLTYGAALIEL